MHVTIVVMRARSYGKKSGSALQWSPVRNCVKSIFKLLYNCHYLLDTADGGDRSRLDPARCPRPTGPGQPHSFAGSQTCLLTNGLTHTLPPPGD